jgi:hypothetical protein
MNWRRTDIDIRNSLETSQNRKFSIRTLGTDIGCNVTEIGVLIGAPRDDAQRNCDRARKMLDTVGDIEGVTMCDTILAQIST